MKKILLSCCIILLSTLGFAQSPSFNEGNVVINAGIGFGTGLYSGRYYSSTVPPISVSAEFGVKDDFITDDLTLGIGGYVGHTASKWESTWYNNQTYGWKYSYTVIGVRGSLHYPLVDKLDTYAGLMIGYNIVSSKEIGNWSGMYGLGYNATTGGLTTSGFVGGRYYLADNFGLMLELGWGVAYVNLGVALKF